jgi:hypothetical protein
MPKLKALESDEQALRLAGVSKAFIPKRPLIPT